MRISFFVVLAFVLSAHSAFLQSGFLDPDFGSGGWVHTDFGGKDQANAVAIQADGKILVGGQTNAVNGGFDFALIRYLSNGDPDPDFGTFGKMTWDFGSLQENIEFINVLDDQKIIVGGWSNNSPNSLGILIRLNSDGSPDTSFGDQGILKYRFGRSTGPLALVVQDDGRYLVSGITVVDSFDLDWIVSRFYPDGKIDSSFNQIGFRYFKFLTRENIPFSILIQKDKKIFMTGCAGVTSQTNFAFLRLNEDGSIDTTFGNGGSLQTDFENNQDVAYTSIVLDDGKYMVSGTTHDSLGNLDFALARYLHDGKLDSTFGIGGKMHYDFKGPVDDGLYMLQQPDGKFLVCGLSYLITHNSYIIVRFNPDGSIDPSFGKNGVASFDAGNILAYNTPSFAMQKDGRLVMVANYKDGTNIDFLTMRFLDDITINNKDLSNKTSSISAYPNPFANRFTLQYNSSSAQENIFIELMNPQGQLIESKMINASDWKANKIDFSSDKLIPGIYFLKWTSKSDVGVISIFKN